MLAHRLVGENRSRLAFLLVVVSLVFGVFAVASAHRWAIVVGAMLSLTSTLPYWGTKRGFTRWPPLILFLGVCAVFTAFQVIALPAFVVRLLSPARYNIAVDNAAALLHSPATFLSLSLDPPATMRELGKLVGYLAFAYSCLRIAGRRRLQLGQAIAGLGGSIAAIGLGHKLVGATSLFGIYDPEFVTQPLILAPLLNSNHLAGLMALCAPVALGLAIQQRGNLRIVWIINLLLCSGVGILSQSRAGVIVLGLGLLSCGLLCFLQRRSLSPVDDLGRRESRRKPIAQIVVGLCVLILLAIATGKGVLSDISATSSDEIVDGAGKIGMWQTAIPLVSEYPLVGIGRGAYEQAVSRVQLSTQFSYAALENEYLQAIVDWGVLGALVAAAMFLVLGISSLREAMVSPLAAGCVSGLAAIALQNMMDFSLSLPGVALPAIGLIALLSPSKPETGVTVQRRKRIHVGLIATGVAILTYLAMPSNRQARDVVFQQPCSISVASELWARHPADYASAGRMAQALYSEGDPRAISVLNRALFLYPKQWGLHWLAARWLYSSSARTQSLVEYASALRNAPVSQLAAIVTDLCIRFPSAEEAAGGLPNDGQGVLRIYQALKSQKRRDVALIYARSLMEFPLDDRELIEAVTKIAMESDDYALALRSTYATRALWNDANSSLGVAAAELAAGNADKARRVLNEAVTNSKNVGSSKIELIQMSARILTSEGELKQAKSLLSDALRIPTAANAGKAAVHYQLADIEKMLGNDNQARYERRVAEELRKKL